MTLATAGITPPPMVKPPVKPEPTGLPWEVPAQKWMNFHAKVLSKVSASKGLRLTVRLELDGNGRISPQKIEETKMAFGS